METWLKLSPAWPPFSLSWFLGSRRPVPVQVLLGVGVLRRRPVCVLSLFLRGAAAAVSGRPAVSAAEGLAQRQVIAVPLTVALWSRNQ